MSWQILQGSGVVSLEQITGIETPGVEVTIEFEVTERRDDRLRAPEREYTIEALSTLAWVRSAPIGGPRQKGYQLPDWVKEAYLGLLGAKQPEPDSWTVIEESIESRRSA